MDASYGDGVMAVKPGEVAMSVTGKQAFVATCTIALLAPSAASAREPRLELHAEWITPACEFPARFRVTLRNTGDEAFSVPLEERLGHARPLNFVATLKEGVFAYRREPRFSSEDFFTPPFSPTNLVDLEPGESQRVELDFDGVFGPHGAARPTYEGRWQGGFVFYYFLPDWVAAKVPTHSPPILSSVSEASAWSNDLDCA